MTETSNIISNLSLFHCGFFAAFYLVVALAIYIYHREVKGALMLAVVSILSGLAHIASALTFTFDPYNPHYLLAIGAFCSGTSPIIMMCIKEAISPDWLTRKRLLIHLSPFILGAILCLIFGNKYILYCFMVYGTLYTITSAIYYWKGIDRREQAVKEYFTDIDSFGHGWVKNFIIFQIICSIGFFFLLEFLTVPINIAWNYIMACYWLYFALKCKEQRYFSTQIPADIVEIIEEVEEKENKKEKEEPAKYFLPSDKMELIETRLAEITERELFTNENLTLASLAQEVGTNRTYLSSYFHLKNTTFYDYINGLRCNYAIEQMKKSPSRSVSELSRLSGYKTENSFRSAFQTIYNQTPAAYKRELRNSAQ